MRVPHDEGLATHIDPESLKTLYRGESFENLAGYPIIGF